MAEESKTTSEDLPTFERKETRHQMALPGRARLAYKAIADWMVLRKRDKPVARVFHVAYLATRRAAARRPLTFVFNGGPGAASAYLHMGALGPRRAVFNADGSLPRPPARLADNAETWLRFTDLVFVDPVGTGFSRTIEADADKKGEGEEKKNAAKGGGKEDEGSEFWEVNRDLEGSGEFIQKFMSKHHRWTSPIFIAGESYGGFRVAKLSRKLQEEFGVGLNGAVLISPAIEFTSLLGSDYDLMHWLDLFPSLAAAWVHDRCRKLRGDYGLETHLRAAEAFAQNDLLALLGQGEAMPAARRKRLYRNMAALTGLDEELIARSSGRVDHNLFARELLREQRRYCGLYDASLTAVDPFPDRNQYEGPDPTLAAITGFPSLPSTSICAKLWASTPNSTTNSSATKFSAPGSARRTDTMSRSRSAPWTICAMAWCSIPI